MRSDLSNNAEQFVPDKDVTETTDDGRTIQLAVKGVPMAVADAMALGLVKGAMALGLVKGAKDPEPSAAEVHNATIAEKRGLEPPANKSVTSSKEKTE